MLKSLSQLYNVDIDNLLAGTIEKNSENGGNMKKLQFYVCPQCGNIITAGNEAQISCCGKLLKPLTAAAADDSHRLSIEQVENEWYISAEHPMTKDHYIAFTAMVTGDRLILNKAYPEWDLSLRLPKRGHGILYYYCTEHGLFRQLL